MRPTIRKIGTCATGALTMLGPNGINYFDSQYLREKAIQLINADGHWVSGTVAIQCSLDLGATWTPVTGMNALAAAGWYLLPAGVVGRIRAVASALPASTSIDIWLAGLDSRTDNT